MTPGAGTLTQAFRELPAEVQCWAMQPAARNKAWNQWFLYRGMDAKNFWSLERSMTPVDPQLTHHRYLVINSHMGGSSNGGRPKNIQADHLRH